MLHIFEPQLPVLTMINFSNLASERSVVVPVLKKAFQFERKKYFIDCDDGWWVVSLNGNKAIAQQPYIWVGDEKNYKWVFGYSYGNQLVFSNFDIAKRIGNFDVLVPLHFNTSETFSSIRVVLWETKQFFYVCPNYADIKIYDVKMTYDTEQSLDSLKGITPELKTLYLFHSFERDQLKEILRQTIEKENHEKRMHEIPYRLKMTLERSGAKLLGYSQSGNRIIIDWELDNGEYKYNSVIDADSWMVIEAGYCLSGGDKKLNLTSLAKTAEEYEDRDVIFITRH